jgi:regulatory protein
MGGRPDAPVSAVEARAIAGRFLARREYSRHELGLKLQSRGVDAATAAECVAWLGEHGLVSDTRFAEMFVRSRVARLFGPLKIRAQLRHKGIADELADTVLSAYEETWVDHALSWIRKRVDEPLDRRGRARLYRSGMNRGFSHEQMMRALDRHQAQP